MRRKCGCSHQGHGPHRCGEMGFSVGDYLTAAILKELLKKPMHVYDLYEKIINSEYYPFKHDQSVVYSLLRKLNSLGFLRYSLEEGNGGVRKVYEVTEEGSRYLEELTNYIADLKDAFEKFLNY
ncbi:MAG: PadR family transcriptional regulator [Fervidobacterium pennivorans]